MRRLLIFLKYPTLGQVKTRLAASLGNHAASEIYRACTELTLERLETLREEIVLCVDPPDALERTRAWLGGGWTMRPQRGETLGERLAHATGEAFAEGIQRVVTVGTDSPWLAASDIEEAFERLRTLDVVLGPTEDGGYYLIGLSHPTPALFEGIAWSSSSVYTETLTKARALGLQVHTLRTGYDVDRMDDLQRLLADTAVRNGSSTLLKTIERSCQRSDSCLS